MNPLHMVSEAVLLEGSWCALEQAGRLLNAAVGVHDRGDAGTALVLALFGREEVGRSRILRALANEVAHGATFDATAVAKRCGDHSTKQREAASGTTIRIPAQSRLSQAVHTRGSVASGSPEWQTADDAIQDAVARKAKRDPQDWHALRERALYVDLSSNATGWSRPSTIDAADAREHIEDAVGDYAVEYDGLRDEVIGTDFPQMQTARATMRPMPTLLPPIWPSMELASNRLKLTAESPSKK